ncbi:hypothetical protein F442_19187 [Phytophthora nicotianae P10297]|uniref:Uncharacterized protein n=5 Tax=Phytophthora nicotianae TaxID=4792 RepID=W2QXW2_PHYN3|nr:hypothetical protein PPTG_05495 [Phytophthora nicotianae INRA-310]ETN17781.1 hypothetical protein PPTG_05495 [Phytophthora nicotianae INRA-310]ETO62794.1 hypothetical protein F444_19367 [Phytophthora nicotianae P1976]ETP32035.1 hypothetical protein F442_19187 [Phytophthora nicotianae P10297]
MAKMADLAAGTPPSDNGVSEQLTALLLKDDDTRVATTAMPAESSDSLSIPPSSLEAPSHLETPPNRRPLFSSMREALENSGQVKEEPGGYVIKRHSGRQQQFRSSDNTGRSKNRHAKQRSNSKGENASPNRMDDEADAAGYTVIRRRSSCDESTTSHSQSTAKRNPRASTPSRGNKKQPQRPRRGSTSALPQSSSLLASISPAPSTSVPPGFQPRSRVALRPPPGLTPAASGWVVKAAVPADHASKIEEPPVEALWPKVKTTAKTESGWTVATTAMSSEGDFHAQAWPASASGGASSSSMVIQDDQKDSVDDDDLLTRLGVTL